MADVRRAEVFETTLIQQDFALGVISLPRSAMSAEAQSLDVQEIIARLGLETHARLSATHLRQALAALVVNDSVVDLVNWLEASPNAVPLERVSPTAAKDLDQRVPRPSGIRSSGGPRYGSSPREPKRRLEKSSVDVAALESAIAETASEAVVPFAQSPVDMTSLWALVQGVQHASSWVVSPRTNPFVIVEIAGGLFLFRTVQGIGEGVRRGLSEGVHYKLLQLFKVPDDWRPRDGG